MKYKQRDTPGERAVMRVHDQLREDVAKSPHSVVEVNSFVGRTESWLRERRLARRMDFGFLLDILRLLGRGPGHFFRDVLPEEPPILDPPMGEEPAVLAVARRRSASADRPRGRPFGKNFLARLDRLRYEDPATVVKKAEKAVARIDRERLPALLGVLGSTWRLQGDLDRAEHAIYFGWQLATASGDRRLAAELLQRMAYVMAAHGKFVDALWISERAQLQFTNLGDLAGVGKTLVDQGLWSNYLGRYEAAIEALEGALIYLPKKELRNRFCAVGNMALSYRELGFLEEAREQAKIGRSLSAGLDSVNAAKLLWLEAGICVRLGQIETGVDLLEKAVEELKALDPLDASLAMLDLVELHLKCGRPDKASQLTRSIFQLIELADESRVTRATIADLLKLGKESVRLSVLRDVLEKLRNSRAGTSMSWEHLL